MIVAVPLSILVDFRKAEFHEQPPARIADHTDRPAANERAARPAGVRTATNDALDPCRCGGDNRP